MKRGEGSVVYLATPEFLDSGWLEERHGTFTQGFSGEGFNGIDGGGDGYEDG